MRSHARILAATIAAAAVVLVPGDPAGGYSWFQYGGYDVIWAGNEAVRYMSPSTFPPDSTTDVLYRAAMGLWVIVPSGDFQYYYEYYEPTEIDNFDGYSDTVAVPQGMLDPGVLAVTYMVNNGPQWYDMDMLFSENAAGLGWNFDANPGCEAIRDPGSYGISFLLVATHELGHALGLGHDPIGTEPPGSPWFIATMNPYYPDGGPIGDQAIIELHADDRNGTRYLYPHSGPSETVVDLADSGYASNGPFVGEAQPATFSPSGIYPGELLTLRSVVENFGNEHVFNVSQGFYLSTDAVIDVNDELLGYVLWDLPTGSGFEFDVEANMPADIAAGEYYLGSILDDLDEVVEEYEDNNVHTYCDPLTVLQLAPAINEMGQEIGSCSAPYTGPAPVLTHPLNMAPLTWSIDNPPTGMTISPSTGVIYWPEPVPSPFLYTLIVRATNDAGSDTVMFFLGIEKGLPQIEPIADQYATPGLPYVGPTPLLVDEGCMGPILNWSLDSAPPGMTINHATGVVSWADPVYAPAPYEVTIRATNSVGNGTVTWDLWVLRRGDLDCDGDVDFGDINPFVLALVDPATYNATYGCYMNGDVDGDGEFDFGDINPFVALLVGK